MTLYYCVEQRKIDLSISSKYFKMKYRFVSLYNGARGLWRKNRDKAKQDGQRHQRIINKIHMRNKDV